MDALGYVWAGVLAVFQGPALFDIFGISISITLVMVFCGLLTGIVVGSTPGLAGPMAMAISLPILISVFGYHESALLPVLGFLIGVMKGATVGGAVFPVTRCRIWFFSPALRFWPSWLKPIWISRKRRH
jgi:putative tricarboxylic transport membrane protein